MIAEGPWLPARAGTTPGREALLVDGRRVSYGELDAAARRRAAALCDAGVGEGDVVALWAPSGPEVAELLHALSWRGAALLPLNARLTAREAAFQLRDVGARALVAGGAALAGRAREALERAPGARLLRLESLSRDAAPPAPAAWDPERPLAILYTSGTTGRPKGAVLSHRAFFWSAVDSALRLGAERGDRWLACMPLFHVGGLSILVRSVLAGTSVAVHDRFDAVRASRALDGDGIRLASFVPTMLERLLAARGERPAPAWLRAVLVGGAAAPRRLLRRALERGFPLAPTYGLTEACSQVATRAPGLRREPLDGHLRPLFRTRVRVVDEAGRTLAPGRPGEIQVAGPTLMRGYWRRPEETAAALSEGWLRTGDVGVLDAQGGLQVLDRRADLVVSGGENVYPAEVEAVLAEHPDVADVGVAGVPDDVYGARPAAWWVARDGARADAEALRAFCRERLAGYKVPVAFHRVRELPRGASGKLLRRALTAGPAARS